MRFHKKRFQPTSWIRALWVGWAFCVLLFFAFWAAALTDHAASRLKTRGDATEAKARRLSDAFLAIQVQQSAIMLPLARSFSRGQLSEAMLEEARLDAAPFFNLFTFDRDSRVLDDSSPSPWLKSRVVREVSGSGVLATLRPLPVGFMVGMDNGIQLEPEPESYLITAVQDRQHRYLVAQANLDELFGPWLESKLKELDLGPCVRHRRVIPQQEGGAFEDTYQPVSGEGFFSAWASIAKSRHWTFYSRTFFAESSNPFDLIEISVDNSGELASIAKQYLLILAAGIVVLGSFALAVLFAERGFHKEFALAEARANFTAMVSHELKTPVAAIGMYAEILEHGLIEDREKVSEYYRIIGTEAGRLRRLIDNLLDLGKIERGAKSYQREALDLNRLVAEAIREASSAFDRSHPPEVRFERAEALPSVRVDREATVQAISNLVHNALKYGGESSGLLVRTLQAGAKVMVEILDRGPGIPVAKRSEVFEPYVRLEAEERRHMPGTGLGLALVKGYVEGQGGTIEIADRPGGGLVFRMSFAATDAKGEV